MARLAAVVLLVSLIHASAFVRPLHRFQPCRNPLFCEPSNIAGEELGQDEGGSQAVPPNESVTENATVASDPRAEAIKLKEAELAKVVAELENTLRYERMQLAKARDRLSETGKTGYFMVQAQVADFMVS